MDVNLKNKHPRDDRIEFQEDGHKYFVDGDGDFISGTAFVSLFFPKFDPDAIIEKYYEKWQNNSSSKYFGMTPEEIKQYWEDRRDEGSANGSHVHKQCEDFLLGHDITDPTTEFHQFKDFLENCEDIEPYRVEWCLYGEEERIAGTIDLIVKWGDEYVMIDHKTNANLSFQGFRGETAKEPIQHIENSDLDKYSLQLSLYNYLLSKYYGIKCSSKYLLWLSQANTSYQLIKCHDYEPEIEFMIHYFLKHLYRKKG